MKGQQALKLKDEKPNETGLQEQSSVSILLKDFKDAIFNVLFVLLDKDEGQGEQTFTRLVFESGLDYLQMMVFPFNAAVILVWNGGDTLTSITNLFTKINVSTYMPSVNFNTFLLVVYILIVSIIMVILDIIYVSYSFSKKKFRFTWPLILLAQIVPLFVTVLFLPITETLLEVVQCQESAELGKAVMTSFPDVVCWQGWHLFHSVITLLFSSIFVFISSVVGLAMFEPRMSTNRLSARQNSQAQVIFIVNKIAAQFVFSFTPFEGTYMYVIMLFGLSGWLFWTYNMNDPYYNKSVGKFYRIASTYYFWTNFMLMVSQVLLATGFSGGLVIWLSGLPFLWMIIVFDKQSNIDKLFSSNLKFRTGEQLEGHLKYVLQLIQNEKTDKNSYMLLIGYIEKHKQVCTEEDCPLKQSKKKLDVSQEMEDNCVQLIKQLERMYKEGIKKYPNCTKLRLSFAFFYLERTKNKKKAYEQFSHAEKTDPAFEEEFIIYRFRKIIRQNLENDENDNESDLIEIIRFDNHISLCEEGMYTSARLHKQFWMELKQEIPDLKKLNEVGSKITQTLNVVRQNYAQIQKINNTVPQVIYSYGIYLILIQQQFKSGKGYLQMSKKIFRQNALSQKISQEIQLNVNFLDSDLGAMILISAKQDSLGRIQKVNLHFIELTGYTNQELFSRNLQKILPDIFGFSHENCMRNWLNNESSTLFYFSNFNSGYLQHKSGFAISVRYKVAYQPEQDMFVAIFKPQTNANQVCHILTDSSGVIKDISAKGFMYFQLDKPKIEAKEINIKQLGILNKRALCSNKEKIKLQLGIDKRRAYYVKVKAIKMESNQPESQVGSQEELTSKVQDEGKQQKIIGYAIQVEKGEEKLTKITDMQVEADLNENSNYEQIIDMYNTPDAIQILLVNHLQTLKKNSTLQFRDYGKEEKIKIMRLIKNEIKMVYNQDSDGYYNQDSNQFFNEEQYQLLKMSDENYQAKIKKAINTNLNHVQVKLLRWLSFLFLLILFCLLILQLVITTRQLNKTIKYGDQIQKRSQEADFLSRMISQTFQNGTKTQFIDVIENHQVEMEGNFNVNLTLQDSTIVVKNIRDAVIYMEAMLMEYFESNNSQIIIKVYQNFIDNICIALDGDLNPFVNLKNTTHQSIYQIKLNIFQTEVLFGAVILVSLAMTIIWIIIELQIDKKKFGIMIWFLDIPIPYVCYLGNHCDKYLKAFVGMKQLKEKGINLQEQHFFESYTQKKDQNEQEMEEQQKARKTLIARHKKQTLLEKLNASYIKHMWLVIYSCIFSTVLIAISSISINRFNFLEPQWSLTSRQLIWGNAIELLLRITDKYPTIPTKYNVNQFLELNKNRFINTIRRDGINQFNQQILDYSLQTVATAYKDVYYSSICRTDNCKSLLDGKLQVGYMVYAKYLNTAELYRVDEISLANHKYASPALIGMISIWKQAIEQNVTKDLSLCSIALYLYIIFTILGYLIGWMMYLRTINTDINQTIQMLNMIPLNLLPKSRKQTRQFIGWIITEANKKQHQK